MVKLARTGGEANAISLESPEHIAIVIKLYFVVIMVGMIGIERKFK